jgi:hypothetical protein
MLSRARGWWMSPRRGPIGIALALFAALGLLAALWPDWTLRYIDALAWPIVALVAIISFGPALARRVPALSSLHLPGGVVATFEQDQQEEASYAELAEAWGPAIDDDAFGEADALAMIERERSAQLQEGVMVLAAVIGAFQLQLDFLQTLTKAERGLTHGAARQWFSDELTAKGADPTTWNLDNLLSWLLGRDAISLQPDGTYRITQFGERVIGALHFDGLFIAPKLI